MADLVESAAVPSDPEPRARTRPFGIAEAVGLLRSAGHPALLVGFLAVALLAGFLEATVILVVVGIAATLAEGTDAVAFSLGSLDLSITRGEALLLGVGLTALLIAVAV